MDRKPLADFLLDANLITPEQLKLAQSQCKDSGLKLTQTLVEMGIITEKDLRQAYAEQLQVPCIDLDIAVIEPEVLSLVSKNMARKYLIMPIKVESGRLTVAVSNPCDVWAMENVREHIKRTTGCQIDLLIATESDIIYAINKYYYHSTATTEDDLSLNRPNSSLKPQDVGSTIADTQVVSAAKTYNGNGKGHSDADLNSSLLETNEPAVVQLVKSIILEAVRMNASDIHVEPRDDELIIRYRIDGLLRRCQSISKELIPYVIARIKIMCDMDISLQHKPQDARTKIQLEDRQIDLRISTLPTIHGEKVVIRILDKTRIPKSLQDVGLLIEDLNQLRLHVEEPFGAIIVTGPTGSGKTSTLHAILRELSSESVNIITIEDPIEYEVGGINQVQVNEKRGLTFASGLRSVLRQDPDIIMVGEMRDSETAEVAFRAAMTGHLVLSTLHTNTALYSITRLMDMGVEPYLISSALISVVAQRLIRRLCSQCREPYKPKKDEIAKVLGLSQDDIPDILFRGSGCQNCNGTGYKGRIGIFEIVGIDDQLRENIIDGVPNSDLFEIARSNGMKTLAEDGLLKAFMGYTTIEEVCRTTKIADIDRRAIAPSVIKREVEYANIQTV